jgi:hypothetical protein
MDEDKFMEWFGNNYDDNAISYAESKEEDFEEYCLNKYISGRDKDMAYDMWRDQQIEDNYLNR